jgi:hypothetical protein
MPRSAGMPLRSLVYFIPYMSKLAINEMGKIKFRLAKKKNPEITFSISSIFKGKLEIQCWQLLSWAQPR